jgi:hypothetical protein
VLSDLQSLLDCQQKLLSFSLSLPALVPSSSITDLPLPIPSLSSTPGLPFSNLSVSLLSSLLPTRQGGPRGQTKSGSRVLAVNAGARAPRGGVTRQGVVLIDLHFVIVK